MEPPPAMFNSVEEECCFWKEKAYKYFQEKIDSQAELEDFTEESRQLEAELEAHIEQDEKSIKALRSNLNQLQIENESQRKKLFQYENEVHSLDQQNKTLTTEKETLKHYIRELEQKNDDLERANRIVSESVAGIETSLNQAYEKIALLEMEVDEKETLQVKLQRMMDETRDLKHELSVKNHRSSIVVENSDKILNNNLESSRIELVETRRISTGTSMPITSIASPDTNGIQTPIKHTDLIGNSYAMTPSAKIAALNIVADLLRKVNALQKKTNDLLAD